MGESVYAITFSPTDYLEEYYRTVDEENLQLLQFFHDTYASINNAETLLEIGGGPTIYSLISASSSVSSIHFCEFNAASRQEVERWVMRDPGSFDWTEYFRYVLRMQGREPTPEAIMRTELRLRGKIEMIAYGNVFDPQIIDEGEQKYDIVSVNFCPESITSSGDEYALAILNIAGKLKSGGHLIMTALQEAESYSVLGRKYPAYYLDKERLRDALRPFFTDIRIRTIQTDAERGYRGFLLVNAKKK